MTTKSSHTSGSRFYDILDHEADIGIRVTGEGLAALFLHAAEAMFDLMVRWKHPYTSSITVPIQVTGNNREELFVNWLSELLFIYEHRRLVLNHFWIDEIDDRHVSGGAKGMKFDDARHEPEITIKGITYHQLKIEKQNDIYSAQVIFDL
ncbi:MAG: archease [Deltaproteobacteria bacterium]|nr:archease [Deltaproteobacteria bacterium]